MSLSNDPRLTRPAVGSSHTPSEPIIDINCATVYRGETRVFSNLTLRVTAGSHTAILGPNGAGKSTLLKLLSRDLYPLAREGSSVKLFGRERWNVWELRRHLGIVSFDLQQEYGRSARGLDVILSGYYSSLHVYDYQHFSPAQRDRAREVMQTLGVADLKDRVFAEMSTGEQRRVLLGRALIHDPRALVLDEPTTGLDLKACFQYLDIVRGLMRAGKTVILVTHHIHEIPPEISRLVLLKNGTVIADGQKADLFTAERLSSLFDTPLHLMETDGFYHVMPAR